MSSWNKFVRGRAPASAMISGCGNDICIHIGRTRALDPGFRRDDLVNCVLPVTFSTPHSYHYQKKKKDSQSQQSIRKWAAGMILEEVMKITDFFKSTLQDSASLEARFSQGDMNAVSEIMLTHQNGIYQLGLRLFSSRERAADFYQDVFIKLYEKHQYYNPIRPLKPWIYQVAMNLGRDRLRRKREVIMADERMPEPSEQPRAEKQILQAEVKTKVWQVMNQLNPTYREILALRFSSDLSLKEIAQVLVISISAAKVRLCRGLKAFETSFKAQGGEHYVL